MPFSWFPPPPWNSFTANLTSGECLDDLKESFTHLERDSTLLVLVSPTESVETESEWDEPKVISNNNEEEEKEGNLRDVIEIDNVIDNTFDNHASEILNTIDEAVPNGISDIWVKLDSIGNSPNVCKRDDSKVLGIEEMKSVRVTKLT